MTKIDRDVFEALSSETRTQILKELGKRGTTPTFLSQKLSKHKSTIVEHLKVLQDSGLVEREAVEGRKRVVYSLTSQGRRLVMPYAQVSLILSTSIISFVLGIGAFAIFFIKKLGFEAMNSVNKPEILTKAEQTAQDMLTTSGTRATELASNYVPFLYAGLILFTVGLLVYSYWKRKTQGEKHGK